MRVKNRLIPGFLIFILSMSGPATAQSGGQEIAEFQSNILHLEWGGIAKSDGNEHDRHWSTWSVLLIDGKSEYGWSSGDSIIFPHSLNFELAGSGTIDSIALDNRPEQVAREDGSLSQETTAASVREFELLGSLDGVDGTYFTIAKGEAAKDGYSRVTLDEPVQARWLKLVIKSNWGGGGATRLSELEIFGELDERGAAAIEDISGVYDHEYGGILLRQDGHEIYGCYGDGYGQLRGQIFGRIMRLSWFSAIDENIGSATFSVDDSKIYGFWYGQNNVTGTAWNSEKSSTLEGVDLGGCQAAIYPKGGAN